MKGQLKNNYLLAACVLMLAAICFLSVYSPVSFDRKRAERELAVKQQLIKIRTAEERYKAANEIYAGSFAQLIDSGYLADSLQYIPHSGQKRFSLAVTTIISKSGRQIPLMECGATYEDYLDGLDANSVAQLMRQAVENGTYPGLKIGSLDEPNGNAGNWEK